MDSTVSLVSSTASTSQSEDNSTACPVKRNLLTLPAEVRFNIYEILFADSAVELCEHREEIWSCCADDFSLCDIPGLHLLSTCKQLYEEAFPIMAKNVHLIIGAILPHELITLPIDISNVLSLYRGPKVVSKLLPFVQNLTYEDRTPVDGVDVFGTMSNLKTFRIIDSEARFSCGAIANDLHGPALPDGFRGSFLAGIAYQSFLRLYESGSQPPKRLLQDPHRSFKILYQYCIELDNYWHTARWLSCLHATMYIDVELFFEEANVVETIIDWKKGRYNTFEEYEIATGKKIPKFMIENTEAGKIGEEPAL